MRQDLFLFVHRVFREVVPGTEFIPNWHLRAITHVLTEVGSGARRRQVIEVPPRSLKSICASVALVAWLLGRDPTRKIICVSYSQELASRFSLLTRQVMKSDWYQRMFPGTRISPEKDRESYFRTTFGGFRDSTSVGGTLTGNGADLIIIDDPAKPDEMMSESQRDSVNDWFDRTLITRLNNKAKDGILLVMQRLHPSDLAGHVRAQGGWDVLSIPAIATQDEEIPLGAKVHRRRAGEVLDPAREPLAVLHELKLSMGSRNFEAQYQQNPLALDGGVLDWRWFRTFTELPELERPRIIQSWDCASKNTEFSDYSVCTTWLVHDGSYYLVDLFRKKLIFPELIQVSKELAVRWRPTEVLIEDAAAGIQLIQQLVFDRPTCMPLPKRIKPEKDKRTRAHTVAPVLEQGRVFIPLTAPWLDDFRLELIQFPDGKYDDQIDSVTQFLGYAERQRMRGPSVVCMPMFGRRDTKR
ncbi:phage terminase large subunit [Sphingomonas sp. IC-11]|nr:phage terminase large subunit [Sphingomonas sp. IC-11]